MRTHPNTFEGGEYMNEYSPKRQLLRLVLSIAHAHISSAITLFLFFSLLSTSAKISAQNHVNCKKTIRPTIKESHKSLAAIPTTQEIRRFEFAEINSALCTVETFLWKNQRNVEGSVVGKNAKKHCSFDIKTIPPGTGWEWITAFKKIPIKTGASAHVRLKAHFPFNQANFDYTKSGGIVDKTFTLYTCKFIFKGRSYWGFSGDHVRYFSSFFQLKALSNPQKCLGTQRRPENKCKTFKILTSPSTRDPINYRTTSTLPVELLRVSAVGNTKLKKHQVDPPSRAAPE